MKKITISLLALVLVCGAGTLFYVCILKKTHTNFLGMEFVLIPAGSYLMGADKNIEDAQDYETPIHRVTLSKPFYLGKYEVTQEQWMALMGNNPSKFKGPNNPVEQVSWYDVLEFIRRLNQKEKTWKYRLPTEAEWEYAARAGTESIYYFGYDSTELGAYAWYDVNSEYTHHRVGQKEPNAWGLYDMHGNVWEWVQDWFQDDYYDNSPGIDPAGPSSENFKVVRGGAWNNPADVCRSATRAYCFPDKQLRNLGFRLAMSRK